jgi:hypothetical protein
LFVAIAGIHPRLILAPAHSSLAKKPAASERWLAIGEALAEGKLRERRTERSHALPEEGNDRPEDPRQSKAHHRKSKEAS